MGLILGQEDLLEEEMATHFSILAWKIPWTEELVGFSPRGCKELDASEQQQRKQQNNEKQVVWGLSCSLGFTP